MVLRVHRSTGAASCTPGPSLGERGASVLALNEGRPLSRWHSLFLPCPTANNAQCVGLEDQREHKLLERRCLSEKPLNALNSSSPMSAAARTPSDRIHLQGTGTMFGEGCGCIRRERRGKTDLAGACLGTLAPPNFNVRRGRRGVPGLQRRGTPRAFARKGVQVAAAELAACRAARDRTILRLLENRERWGQGALHK